MVLTIIIYPSTDLTYPFLPQPYKPPNNHYEKNNPISDEQNISQTSLNDFTSNAIPIPVPSTSPSLGPRGVEDNIEHEDTEHIIETPTSHPTEFYYDDSLAEPDDIPDTIPIYSPVKPDDDEPDTIYPDGPCLYNDFKIKIKISVHHR